MNNQNHYSVLCIDRNASGAEIKNAYRRLAHRFHPDVTADPDGESKFKAVAEAYRALRRSGTHPADNHGAASGRDDGATAWSADPLLFWYAVFPWPAGLWFWPRQA